MTLRHVTVVSLGIFAFAALATELKVSSDFPGGSAKVESIDQQTRTIRVSPVQHPGKGWDCWWYFKVEGIQPGETLTIDVGAGTIGASWTLPNRAVYSLDNKTWPQTTTGEPQKNRRSYQQKIETDHCWFAWGPVFVLQHAQELVDCLAKESQHATAFELCKSAEGHSVPAVRITQKGGSPKYGIWFSARQHAWESGSSWVARGVAEWLVSDDPRAEELRKKAVVVLVPVMDMDNVERGAGGKTQTPHDHNRDWSENPNWPEVRAAQKIISEMNAAGKFDIFLDLHNPASTDALHFFMSAKEVCSDKTLASNAAFIRCAQAEIIGPLRYNGQTKISDGNYDKDWRQISNNWVNRTCAPHVVALCLETSWNAPQSTAENYQRVGKELGLAVERFLREPNR